MRVGTLKAKQETVQESIKWENMVWFVIGKADNC